MMLNFDSRPRRKLLIRPRLECLEAQAEALAKFLASRL